MSINKTYTFSDFFNIDEIQHIQDLFAKTTGVASIISTPEGIPITKPSGFTDYCKMIRNTEQGSKNCMHSDAIIGKTLTKKPIIQRCLSGGLFDSGAAIMAGQHHIANWLIGQVIDEDVPTNSLLKYAEKLGIEDPDIQQSINRIVRMSKSQFSQICEFLFYYANLLSNLALDNLLKKEELEKRTNIQEQLIKEKEQFRVTLASIGDAVISTDKYGNISYINEFACRLLNISELSAHKKPIKDVLTIIDESSRQFLDVLPSDISQFKIIKDKKNLLLKDTNGIEKAISLNVSLIEDINCKSSGYVIVIRDNSSEREHEKALMHRDNRHTALISNINDVIAILSKEGTITYKSPNVKRIFGWEPTEMIGESGLSTIHPDDRNLVMLEIGKLFNQSETSIETEFRYLCKDGSYKEVHLVAANLLSDKNINGILLNYRDISEKKKLERQKNETEALLRNQQKLESIGVLASGVAHEINNPINGILNYGQLLLDSFSDNEDIKEYASEIIHESERVSSIVKNLLQFSRDEKRSHSYSDISDIINSTTSLIKTIIQHDQIQLDINIADGIPKIKCRSQQIQQVIMNLLTNARDSLNEKYESYDKNKIIKLNCITYKEENNNWIRIIVEDHGVGIPKKIQDNILDPFFTTKDRSKGTGLGLSISYGIVKDHHGRLTFQTEEGNYTKFYLDLPCDNGWTI